uniref:Piwi domain-containing protein n=1 Tax=Panagrolaimus davidi TaxID=227884 RepID=A0A914QUE6_9BILA
MENQNFNVKYTDLKNYNGTLQMSLKFTVKFTFADDPVKWTYALDIILAQTAMKANKYVPCGNGKLFETGKTNFIKGLEYREGCMKSIYCKNINGERSVFLCMDYVKHAFLPSNVKLMDAWNLFSEGGEKTEKSFTDFNVLYSGAKVQVIKDVTKILRFKKICNSYKAETDNGIYELPELKIVPFQLVGGKQIPEEFRQDESSFNLLDRKERLAAIEKQFNNLVCADTKTFLKRFGVILDEKMIKLPFTVLNKPDIIVATAPQNEAKVDDDGIIDYDECHYISPAKLNHFVLLTDDDNCDKLATNIIELLNKRGVKFDNRKTYRYTQKNNWAKDLNQNAFALIIDNNEWSEEMKMAVEKTNGRALHIQWKKELTVQSIVSEINQAAGGWCHSVNLQHLPDLPFDKVLVIAVHTQIRHSTKEHLFVGISANYDSLLPYKFYGWAYIQKKVDGDKSSTKSVNGNFLTYAVKEMLKSNKAFDRVIYLRNEGEEYFMNEMNCVKNAVETSKADIRFNGMIISKAGNVRHFWKHEGEVTDVPIYSVINLTNQTFFFVSTKSKEDAVKACEVEVFEKDDELSKENLQKFLMALATHNQTILPSGLPAPSNISKKYCDKAKYAFEDNNQPSDNASLKQLNENLCPFLKLA